MRPSILFTRLAARVSVCLALALAACSNEATVVTTPDRPMGPLLAVGTDPVSGARIETNQDDYSPGEVVHVTGSGWAPNETIAFFMTEDPDTHEDVTSQVVADSVGAFSIHFYDVQSHDIGVTFTLTATGLSSGSSATAVFTDGNVRFITATTANLVASVTYNRYNSSGTCGGDANQVGQTLNYNTGLGLNAGQSILVTIPTVAGYTYTGYSNGGITITPPSSSGNTTLCVSGFAEDVQRTFTLNYQAVVSNTPPVLGAIGNQSTPEGTALTFTATATDDGLPAPPAALTYSLQTPGAACLALHPQVPAGATITGAGAFSWTPTESEGPQTYCARVQVSDGALTDFEDIEIAVTEGNAAPVLTAIGNQSVNELVELSFTPTATDSDLPANTLTFSLGTPDAGCGFPIAAGAAVTAGVFSWTPTEAQGPGTYCARVIVSDGTDTDHEDFQIAVAEVNVAPVLDAIGSQQVNELVQLGFTATGSDADLPANTKTFSIGTPDAGCGHPIAAGAAITAAGAFTWTPTEAQGPGTFCARVVLSDGAVADFEDFVITVAEVNVAPVLTVPADFSVAWGVAISGKQASATDSDLPANTLTFSLVGEPAGMTINSSSGLISWTPTSAQIGPHTITVLVTDNGTPALSDNTPTFTITVTTHGTTLVYDGSTSGQYSDQAQLSATLTDNVTNTAISGATISFTFNGAAAGSDATDANGKAEVLHTVANPDGNVNVAASFAGTALYGASGPTSTTFNVDAEDANVTPDAGNLNAYQVGAPGGSASFSLTFVVQEDVTPAPEPDANDGALAGNIANAVLTVQLVPVGAGTGTTSTCNPITTAGTGYSGTKTYVCPFSNMAVETYELKADLNGTYYRGGYSDVVTVFDPSLGFATGGGTYTMDGDRVNFGFVAKVTQNKKNTVIKGSLLVIRHKSNGEVARIKSNVFDALAIGTGPNAGTATFSGKAIYSVNGVIDPTNYDFTAYVKDGGTPGAGVDQFSLFHAKGDAAAGYEVRTSATLAALKNLASIMTLTGGNIQVPQGAK